MKEPLVYIVLLNWNGYKDTIECISTLNKISYKNYKVIIVDNNSTNESVKEFKKKVPQIKLIVNKENLGFSGGCNVGIQYSLKNKADYVLLLNNDTLVNKDFLQKLVKVMEEKDNIGIASPFIYLADKRKSIWSSGLNANIRCAWPFNDENQYKEDKGQFKKLRYIDFLTGCSMLIRKEVFQKVGLLRDDYFLYIEDMDFSIRTTKAGFKLCAVPQSKIWHKVGQSSKKEGAIKVKYYFIRNLILYFKYNYSFKDKYIFYFVFVKEYMYQSLLLIKKREYSRIKPIILGLIHGFLGRTGYSTVK